ncbi:hypothetical protein EC973_008490 [Apophysomyces ossiformis]|uniref:Uncharacterized protein n=1 Tax=Apophysomyces ossiformis TaxID=679940 RepID=A0A8H7BSH8_9FUNG|nr:hypothetical protein EC973_008490 [Apophysomyces ossiformis]
MSPTDQFMKATDLTTHIPLPEETAIPAPSRKRNNSLIPLEFMNDDSEGGRERAALATVFGVREYTESKIFWSAGTGSRQDEDDDEDGFVAITGRSIVSSPLASPQVDKDHPSITSLINVLDQVGSNSESLHFPPKHTFMQRVPSINYTLPAIPVVSKFTEDDFVIPAEQSSSTEAFLLTPPQSKPSLGTVTQPPFSVQPGKEERQTPSSEDVAPPLVFIGYPPAIFDLLKSDTDNRIIVWGPDPQALSASMDTVHVEKPVTTATSVRPVRGFSSNTTSTATSITSIEKKRSKFGSRWSAQLLPLKKGYLHFKGKPHSVTPSGANLEDTGSKGSLLLKKAFKRKVHYEKQSDQGSVPVEIPKVIEAATVEKLVEKLTSTLDYTFMTDFFLTYRSFISPTQLCKLLILRFRWALENDEEDRRVSPRDQRIVKTLKRVVRRLKKVYYRGSASEQRVQVIPPPPPTSEQEKVEEMVRAKLSQSAIRRKTNFVNGVDVGDRHHGNMAVQDARVAPVVVIGSVRNTKPNNTEAESYPSPDVRSLSQPSIARYVTIGRESRKSNTNAIKASYLHRMEQQKKYNAQEDPADDMAPPGSARSSVTDDSLESALSPGTTDPDNVSLEGDQDSNLEYDASADQGTEELEKRRSLLSRLEEEEERLRVEFFSQGRSEVSTEAPTVTPPPLESADTSHTGREDPDVARKGLSVSHLNVPDDQASKRTGTSELSGYNNRAGSSFRELEGNEAYQVSWPPEGLAKTLSKKSIEKRKSERNLQEGNETVVNKVSAPVSQENLQNKPFFGSFEAVPYESTEVPSLRPHSPQQKNGLPKSTSANLCGGMQLANDDVPPPVPPKRSLSAPNVEVNTHLGRPPPPESSFPPLPRDEQQQPPRDQIVIRIVEELRNETGETTKCDCVQCTGQSGAPQKCRRLSVVMAKGDDEKRKSIELRHRRGASIDCSDPLQEEKAASERNNDLLLPKQHTTRTVLSENDADSRLVGRRAVHRRATPAASMVSAATSRFVANDVPEKRHSVPSTLTNSPYRRTFILSYRSETMAQQFCLIERNVLVDIDWEEMVHCRWTKMAAKSEGDEQDDPLGQQDYFVEDAGDMFYTRRTRQIQLARRDREGGVEQVIKRFNAVCQWVASEIVRTKQLDERVQVVEKFIRLAQKCKMFSNFATLVQILLGLQSPSVSRLRKTWARVGTAEMRTLRQLSAFTSPMKNWKHIRDNMTVVAEEYGMSPTEVQIEMPGTNPKISKTKIKLPFGGCIPFLGIYLSDLVFNSEQPSYLEPNHDQHRIYAANTPKVSPVLKQPLVNFRKHRIIATVIKRVLIFQNLARRYAFQPDENAYYDCLQLDPLDHDEIRRLSHEIEP